MSYKIPIEEEDFLKAMSVASTTENDEEKESAKKKLYEELDSIGAVSNNDSGFEKLDYTPKTDEEIAELATNLTEEKYSKELQNYLDSYNDSEEKTQAQKETVKNSGESEKTSVENNYDTSKKEAENQALKRGLGRSSVIMNVLDNYDESKNTQLAAIEKNLNESLAAIDKELLSLESEKKTAMNNLELEKSVELAKKISDLKDERDAKTAEVTEFNNNVTEKILKYGNNAAEISESDKKNINIKKSKAILNYYSGFSAKDAFEDFAKDSSFKDYLGDYYSQLYQLLKAKAQNS